MSNLQLAEVSLYIGAFLPVNKETVFSRMLIRLVKLLFHDKRWTVTLLLSWMLTVCTIFYYLGAFHMGYMHVGPSDETIFMGLKIDNWGKWSALAIFSFCNTGINEFISNALDPWFVNSLQVFALLVQMAPFLMQQSSVLFFVDEQDHKTRSIEYSHTTCLLICQIHCIYVHVMGIFALFLFFSQVRHIHCQNNLNSRHT